MSILEFIPEVAAKLKEPESKEWKFREVAPHFVPCPKQVATAQQRLKLVSQTTHR